MFCRQSQHDAQAQEEEEEEETHLIASVGLVKVTTAQNRAGVGLGTAPVGSGGGIDGVGVNGVVASLDLSGGKASESRGGEEDGGVEHVCNEDLRRLKR